MIKNKISSDENPSMALKRTDFGGSGNKVCSEMLTHLPGMHDTLDRIPAEHIGNRSPWQEESQVTLSYFEASLAYLRLCQINKL